MGLHCDNDTKTPKATLSNLLAIMIVEGQSKSLNIEADYLAVVLYLVNLQVCQSCRSNTYSFWNRAVTSTIRVSRNINMDVRKLQRPCESMNIFLIGQLGTKVPSFFGQERLKVGAACMRNHRAEYRNCQVAHCWP
jgi:hypothetical protein